MNKNDLLQTLQSIHWLDAVIVGVLLLGALIGLWRGVLKQLVRLVQYVASVYASLYFHEPVGEFLKGTLTEVTAAIPRVLSYAVVFLGSYLTLWLIQRLVMRVARKLYLQPTGAEVDAAVTYVGLRPVDKLLGAAVGLVVAALLTGGALMAAAMTQNSDVARAVAGSRLSPYLVEQTHKVLVAVPADYKQELNESLVRFREVGLAAVGETLGDGLHGARQRVDAATKGMKQGGKSVVGN
jgi:uncharacterized membrane protein required for colicin V production